MNNPYTITKIDDRCLVLGNSFLAIEDYSSRIARELTEAGFEGELILDYLLRNGDNYSRLFSTYFDGVKIVWESIVRYNDYDGRITKISNLYYRTHRDLLDNSVLTTRQINCLLSDD